MIEEVKRAKHLVSQSSTFRHCGFERKGGVDVSIVITKDDYKLVGCMKITQDTKDWFSYLREAINFKKEILIIGEEAILISNSTKIEFERLIIFGVYVDGEKYDNPGLYWSYKLLKQQDGKLQTR